MGSDHAAPNMSYLERLDLALASRFVPRATALGAAASLESWAGFGADADAGMRPGAPLITGLLHLRGLDLRVADVQAILAGRASRYSTAHQEFAFVHGLARALALVDERGRSHDPPDGEFAVDLFRAFARDIVRFRNHWLRRDMPWDGLLYVPYPDADDVPSLLATFDERHAYRDQRERFALQHPVRQAFRVLWRLARIAPFPDFNVLMAFLVMNTYLLAKGYPAVTPMVGDRELLMRLLSGPPPQRLPEFEARLVLLA